MSTANEIRRQQIREKLLKAERERELKWAARERIRESTQFVDFFFFFFLSIFTFGIYTAHFFWKKAKVDTNLLRAILSNQEQSGTQKHSGTAPRGNDS